MVRQQDAESATADLDVATRTAVPTAATALGVPTIKLDVQRWPDEQPREMR